MCLISKQTNQQQNYKKAEYNKTYNFPKKKKIKNKSNPWNIEKDMKASRMEHIEETASLTELSKPGLG